VVDVANTLITEAQLGLDTFVNKEQWTVIQMKEEYHAKFATILQIVYQRKRLAYFSNCIAIIFNLANEGKKVNYCSIMLT
jgi:hypothetical protein